MNSSAQSTPLDSWQALRQEMPVAAKWAYFDHAAVSPLPRAARDAMIAWAHQASDEGDTIYPQWYRAVEQVRATAARLLNATGPEIALVRSTTEGINLVAEGFPFQPGDNVVTLENEFPSNIYPWMNQASRGVEVRRVPAPGMRVDLDRLRQACDRRTRIVAISWVGYASGWRCDLAAVAELVHAAGALLLVDAIQGLGVFPLDLAQVPIDFLATASHKWLLAPEGGGIFFIRRQHLDTLRATGIGAHSVKQDPDYTHIELALKPTAARFEGAPSTSPACSAWGPVSTCCWESARTTSRPACWKSPLWPPTDSAASAP